VKQKEQLKNLLVQRGLTQTTDEAERLVLAARVRVEGAVITQAGTRVSVDADITLKEGKKYVSRGGFKLQGALEDFSFDPAGLSCIDVGASSGGFTDCLLRHGAAAVTAVDVGYGQFDWSLRGDSRVKLFEKTNISVVDPYELGAPFDLLVADLSFTSLARLAPQLVSLLKEGGSGLVLVKPQFELPKELVEGGVVRSLDLHIRALEEVGESFEKHSLVVQELSFSRLLGPKGNIEFWIWASKHGATATINTKEIVLRAHKELLEQG